MHLYEVLKRPVITEKSGYLSGNLHRYSFEVDRRANKHEIKQAVEEVFGVSVTAVNVMNVRGKTRRVGRQTGRTPDWKKAIVTVAPGDTIEIFEGA